MSIADLMQAMSDAGAPMAAILIAVRAIEEKDAEIASRRANDRERKQRQRDNERADHGTVTGRSRDMSVTVTGTHPLLDKEKGAQKEINPPPHTHTRDASARRAGTWPCPENVDPAHWSDFLANRKRKRLVNTETARLGVMRDLETNSDDHWPPGRLVEHAAAKGWGSINYPEEGPRNVRTTANGHRNGNAPSGHGRTIDAGFAFIADGEPDRFDPGFAH